MLRNDLYRGERIWNRSEWIKDHETGKRRRYERPESEWVRREDDAWRIVSDEVWERVRARIRQRQGTMRAGSIRRGERAGAAAMRARVARGGSGNLGLSNSAS